MTDSIRCPACRGAKKVPKLGGMIGECNTCSGKGTILAVDKPKPVIVEPVETNIDIIKAVAEAVPVSTVEPDKFTVEVLKPVALPEEPQIKVDGKKALYKRKKA
jgi:hypothetical protein